MVQALYLAQVCRLRINISLCGTRLHEGQRRLLAVHDSRDCQGRIALGSVVEVGSSQQQRTYRLHMAETRCSQTVQCTRP